MSTVVTLYIGNKNYSSWSLRPWLLLRQLGIEFRERKLRLFSDAFYKELTEVTPAGCVPVLVDGDFSVWDSLAIVEYVAEHFPKRGVWPEDSRARARARSACAEMHAGFAHLRNHMPMNIEASLPSEGRNSEVDGDIAKIVARWSDLRREFAAEGPFLFGPFCAADAYYAPVASRFRTYGVELPKVAAAYADALLGLPAMLEWSEEAKRERCFLPEDEPYRCDPVKPR